MEHVETVRGRKVVAGAAIAAAGLAALVPLGRTVQARSVRSARSLLLAPVLLPWGAIHHADLESADLPAPVLRYLKRALPDGAPRPAVVRVRQVGELRARPDGPWMPLSAVEDFTLTPPGFVWWATLRAGPGPRLHVLDSLLAGRGRFGARLGGLVPLGRGAGPEVDASSLLRFLAEAVWVPQALAPGGAVRWTPIDDCTARAHLRVGQVEVAGNFRFAADGAVASFFTEQRFRDVRGQPVRTDWVAEFAEPHALGGVEVPTAGTVRWLLPDGPFDYCRLEVTGVEAFADPAHLPDAAPDHS